MLSRAGLQGFLLLTSFFKASTLAFANPSGTYGGAAAASTAAVKRHPPSTVHNGTSFLAAERVKSVDAVASEVETGSKSPASSHVLSKMDAKMAPVESERTFMAHNGASGIHPEVLETTMTINGSPGQPLDKEIIEALSAKKGGPLKVLFLSSDTGGGHRASAESLGKQFQRLYPGTTYDLLDIWTMDGCLPYRTLVNSYKHLSANPWKWRILYYASNTAPYERIVDIHSKVTCEKKIRKRIASYDPDVVVSVHPTMNNVPMIATKKISKKMGKHIPFFTVVTDFGSGHCTWFQEGVEKIYIASDRIKKLAKKRGKIADHKIVESGLPIRHDFAIQADKLGDRTTKEGKEYQRSVRKELRIDPDKPMVLLMGGGEGVGSLSDITNEMYAKFRRQGIDATICVVCGRNEELKRDLSTRCWDTVLGHSYKPKKQRKFIAKFLRRAVRSTRIQQALDRAFAKEAKEGPDAHKPGHVDVVGLGFVSNMAEYMVAADVLVSKAGPGTIAEAAAVGLPVMLTSFLPGQEAGNVDLVLDGGFGDYNECPEGVANEVACWLQDASLLDIMRRKAMEVGHPHAAMDIVEDIGESTHRWMEQNKLKAIPWK